MRVVLADLRSDRGFVNKDTVVGGYGQRMTGFCAVTRLATFLRRRMQDPPSVTLAYLAAILARAGHEVVFTRREILDGDVALVLSSLVDRLDEDLLATMRGAGLRAITFGVESLSPETLRKVGRRPIPEEQQRRVIEACRRLEVGTVGFYVLGFSTDTWDSIAATIEYAISLGSTLAQFKLLTPYPGTPLYRQMERQVFERDWERFDGFTPTFRHPTLSPTEMQFPLAAAYRSFYLRRAFFAYYWRFQKHWLLDLVGRLDRQARAFHARKELAVMSRAVEC